MKVEDIRAHLNSIDASVGGRVEVFEAARNVAGRVLNFLSIEATEEGETLAAVAVLLTVAGDVLGVLHERADLPVGHVLGDLEHARDLAINLGRLDGAMTRHAVTTVMVRSDHHG